MRIMHTMIASATWINPSLSTPKSGMKLLRRKDYPDGKYTLAFVGYGEESEGAVIELYLQLGVSSYELGRVMATCIQDE